MNLTILDPLASVAEHVVLTAETETPMEPLLRALGSIVPGPYYLRGMRLDGWPTLGEGELKDGDVLTVRPSPTGRFRVDSRLELAATGGPLSGRRWPLSNGATVVGRAKEADLRLEDPRLSRRHLRLTVTGETFSVEDLGSTNGTLVEGRLVQGTAPVALGQAIEAGSTLFELRLVERADADICSDGSGGLEFNRPARIRHHSMELKVAMPAKPGESDQTVPWAQIGAPLGMGVAGAFLFGPSSLLFAGMSLGTTLAHRRIQGKRSRKEQQTYLAELARIQAKMVEAAARELAEQRRQFPDPATVSTIATGPGRRLWERRHHDPDAFLLRVGITDRPASVMPSGRGSGSDTLESPRLATVPVGIDLAWAGVLGVAGPVQATRGVARWLIAQFATLRSPRDLSIIVLTQSAAKDDWDWVRWLPHVRVDDPHYPVAMIGNDQSSRQERIRELLKLVEVRTEMAREERVTRFIPSVLVVLDGVRALRAIPGMPRLLKEGPAVGIYMIGLDDDDTRLAEEGRAQLVFSPDHSALATLEVDGAEPLTRVLLDQVDPSWAEEVARGLAPVRDAGEDGEGEIPRSVRFVDISGVDLDNPEELAATWSTRGRTTEALVGVCSDGPFTVDLRRDGPHALVAGTTGSGKSEFLQTLVASLALGNRPDAMNFVLIDYKGGGAFLDCEHLVHTVGMVTNLDGHQTERALASLDAELKRRERQLKQLRSPDIEAAWEQDPDGSGRAGLARLVIVIDEFAELVQELPDFVAGLIRIARVGRSLGVHLILATQRPAGVVSPEMRANTGMRVALRMVDKSESSEVLESPVAAGIARSSPGRGFVRTGGRSALVEFQSARVAGRRKGSTEALPPPRVDRVTWSELGYSLQEPVRAQKDASAATDLHALVKLAQRAAEKLGIERSPSPWLPELPSALTVQEVRAAGAAAQVGLAAPFGLEDLPEQQARRAVLFDLAGGQHLLIAGSSRSGRSTALRTIAGSLGQEVSPSDLHMYVLDFGNGSLLSVGDLPHCGAAVSRSEIARAERLIERLSEELTRRQQTLAEAGCGDILEQRATADPAGRLPYIVILVDRWEGFTAQFPADSPSDASAALMRLVREGLGAGFRVVVSGDRSLLNDRMANLIESKLVLRLADRNDYRLVDINPKFVPNEVPPGRAFRGDIGTEVQLALLDGDPSSQGQAAAVRRLAGQTIARWPESERANRPLCVETLPAVISLNRIRELVHVRQPALWMAVGVGGDELTACGVDLSRLGGFVVGGPAHSGRSTALLAMANWLVYRQIAVLALCPKPSPLGALAGATVIIGTAGISDRIEQELAGLVHPVVVFVDDAEILARTPADDALKQFHRARGPGEAAVVVAGVIDDLKADLRGSITEARRAKAGLLLSPSSTLDGDLVGVRLARNQVGRTSPGRGILAVDGRTILVQVPGP
ncbi:MAG: FtsK/SpoIIIE domain-containing protein [Actinomycetota bacterium]